MVGGGLSERLLVVLSTAHDGEDDPPDVGGNSGGVEHMHVVLSGDIAGRVWIRPSPQFARGSSSPAPRSSCLAGRAVAAVADRPAGRLDSSISLSIIFYPSTNFFRTLNFLSFEFVYDLDISI